jgi:hypothetical protein
MAAYHKVEVSLNTNAVEVGVPSPQTVNVTLPTIGPAGPVGSVGPAGPQGPQGVPGTGLEVLTTQGDILYQGASTGQRLAIGTSGQVLKVANGIPAWGAPPESGVSSVNGQSGSVNLTTNDIEATTFSYEVESVNQNNPTVIDLEPDLENIADVDATINLINATGIVYARVLFPSFADTEDVRAVIRLNNVNEGDADITYLRVVDSNNDLVYPKWTGSTSYAELANGYGLEFTFRNRKWELRPIGSPAPVDFPDYVGTLVAYRNPPPASRTSTGETGRIAFDARYMYFCVGAQDWRRIPLANW